MADSASRISGLAQYENGGTIGSVDPKYAEIIVIRHGETEWNVYHRIQVIKDRDLRERHLGDLQGVLYRETAKINPQAHKAFASSRNDLEIPGGGESYNQMYDRCTSALQRIAKNHIGDRVVVVSHGATIEALLTRASPSGGFHGKIPNTCVNVFHLSDYQDEWIIKSWGDASHLKKKRFLKSGFGGDRNSG